MNPVRAWIAGVMVSGMAAYLAALMGWAWGLLGIAVFLALLWLPYAVGVPRFPKNLALWATFFITALLVLVMWLSHPPTLPECPSCPPCPPCCVTGG